MEILDITKLIKSLNPVNGCTAGCTYCFAKRINDRFKITPDFEVPVFFENRLKQITSTRNRQVFFMTSMSDFSGWKTEWRSKVFQHLAKHPKHDYLFLTKFPEKINFETDLDSAWIGVTITAKSEMKRIEALQNNIKAKNYFLTFEPLFSDVWEIDLTNIKWVVIWTETGNRKWKITAQKDWILNIAKQAKEKNIPVFMKDTLLNIVGEENMLQKLPFNK